MIGTAWLFGAAAASYQYSYRLIIAVHLYLRCIHSTTTSNQATSTPYSCQVASAFGFSSTTLLISQSERWSSAQRSEIDASKQQAHKQQSKQSSERKHTAYYIIIIITKWQRVADLVGKCGTYVIASDLEFEPRLGVGHADNCRCKTHLLLSILPVLFHMDGSLS